MIDEYYKEIEALTDKVNSPILVRHIQSKEFFVKKVYPLYLTEKLEKLKQINHRHLPKIQELVPMENELWVYEEFIHGKNLKELMLVAPITPFTTEKILTIAENVTHALSVLHKRNIIHRDIKLTNIMISTDNVVKLIDFDAIRFYNGAKEQDTVNLGTMGFAAPEHFGFSETDERSDLYSLGVVLNVCDTHQYPTKEISQNPYLKPLITKSIKLDPADRFQTADEMNQAIQHQLNAFQNKQKASAPTIHLAKKKAQTTEKKVHYPSPQPKKTKFLHSIPGFRSNIYWKKVVAVCGYCFLLLCYIILAFPTKGNLRDGLLDCLHFTTIFVLPILFFSNFLGIRKKIPVIQPNRPSSKLVSYALLALIWFAFVGTLLQLTENLYSPSYVESRKDVE